MVIRKMSVSAYFNKKCTNMWGGGDGMLECGNWPSWDQVVCLCLLLWYWNLWTTVGGVNNSHAAPQILSEDLVGIQQPSVSFFFFPLENPEGGETDIFYQKDRQFLSRDNWRLWIPRGSPYIGAFYHWNHSRRCLLSVPPHSFSRCCQQDLRWHWHVLSYCEIWKKTPDK